MIKKENLYYFIKLLALTIPLIVLIVFFILFKDQKDSVAFNLKIFLSFILSKDFEPLLIIIIVGILIFISILYFLKNNIESEINRYTFSRKYSPKTYEKVKKEYTNKKMRELKNTPQYKEKFNLKKSASKKKEIEETLKERISHSILL